MIFVMQQLIDRQLLKRLQINVICFLLLAVEILQIQKD